jgi:transposase
MKYVGVDLPKQTIRVCALVVVKGKRKVHKRDRLECADAEKIKEWFRGLGQYRVVVEATSCYEWFVQLVEDTADRVLLAHPKKLRIIAESTRKTDKLDAQVLAEELAKDSIPEAWRPSPRVREHRTLVRYRMFVQRRITGVKCKLRHLLARHNSDFPGLFRGEGRQKAAAVAFSGAERFAFERLWEEYDEHGRRLALAEAKLREFSKGAPVAEREARAVLKSMPGMGPVTIDVILSELGDVRRFRSHRQVTAFAGLAPGIRESAGHAKQLGITKEGSRYLRWAMIEFAWRTVNKSRRWGHVHERFQHRMGAKKAIVAVARRLLGVILSILRSGSEYSLAREIIVPEHPRRFR